MTLRKHQTLGLIFFLLFCVSGTLPAQDFASRFAVIKTVDHIVDSSLSPPKQDAEWTPLPLPMGTRIGNAGESNRVIWMRFELESPQDDSLHALYFHRYNLSLDLFFNGQRIGGDTYKPGRFTTSWNHPLLVNIQNANWNEEVNVVHIRHQTSYFGGAFGQIVFGQSEPLTQLWEDTLFQRVGISSWLQLVGILVTLFSGVLWIIRPRDLTYLLLTGMAGSWTVLTTHMVVYYNVIEYKYWLPLVHLAMHVFGLLYVKLLARLTEIESPILNKFMTIWFVIAVIWNQFGNVLYWWMGTYVLHAVGCLCSAYMLSRIARKALTTGDRLSIAISITVALQLLLFSHDYLLILFGKDPEWETGTYLTQFAFPILLLVFAGILLDRFRSALSLAENLNRELEAKVEASRQVIEHSYAKRRELELEQAAEKERLEIYRNLHDDVGSKLLSIVHAGTDSKLGDLARKALESLRSAVSKANSEEQLLANLLDGIREETQLRLEGSGHHLNWKQSENLPELTIPADKVFNITQVFRELVSNIIRHADADSVDITFSADKTSWSFEVADNGVGFSDCNTPGNGLNNVNQRITEIGGSLQWHESTASGACLTAEIPTT